MGGGDLIVGDVGGEFDLAAEGAVIDLHDVDAEARVRVGGWGVVVV
jgi:hypothetical protein